MSCERGIRTWTEQSQDSAVSSNPKAGLALSLEGTDIQSHHRAGLGEHKVDWPGLSSEGWRVLGRQHGTVGPPRGDMAAASRLFTAHFPFSSPFPLSLPLTSSSLSPAVPVSSRLPLSSRRPDCPVDLDVSPSLTPILENQGNSKGYSLRLTVQAGTITVGTAWPLGKRQRDRPCCLTLATCRTLGNTFQV